MENVSVGVCLVYTNLFILDCQTSYATYTNGSRDSFQMEPTSKRRGNVELSILPKDATAIALAGDRTRDPSIKSPMRYQLRYGGSTKKSPQNELKTYINTQFKMKFILVSIGKHYFRLQPNTSLNSTNGKIVQYIV